MEFHAVVLCGPGHGLAPFAARSLGLPKALLPVANRPMVLHVLDWCAQARFPKVTLWCDFKDEEQIQAAVANYSSDAKINVLAAHASHSGDAMRMARDLKLDHIVLLPCDFVTNIPPEVLIEAYRSREDTDVGMLACYRNKLPIEDKKNKIFPVNYTVYADLPSGQQLLDYYSKEDVEFHKALNIRTQLLWRFPNTSVATKLLDSSIFFMSRALFLVFDSDKFSESYFAQRPLARVVRDVARSTWQRTGPERTVALFVVPDAADFARCNNLAVYLEANRVLLKQLAQQHFAKKEKTSAKDKTAANVGADSLVGEGTEIGEKTNVKRTVVGARCNIGKRVRLTGLVVFDGVTIEDDVVLENCIVGLGVVVRSKCKLVSCNVELQHDVPKGTQSKGDTLLNFSLEGLVDELVLEGSLELLLGSDYDSYEDEYVGNDDGLFAY